MGNSLQLLHYETLPVPSAASLTGSEPCSTGRGGAPRVPSGQQICSIAERVGSLLCAPSLDRQGAFRQTTLDSARQIS